MEIKIQYIGKFFEKLDNFQIQNRKIKYRDIKVLSRQISGMMKSGCDIITILDTLIESSDTKISYVLSIVKKCIKKGNNITESFILANEFPDFFIKMIYAGELSGNLDYIFEKLAQYYDREDRVKSRIISVSIYPLILLFASFIAANVIFLIVIPQFATAFDLDKSSMPVSTKIIFKISSILKRYYIYIYIAVFLSVVLFIKSVKESFKIKFWFDEKKMNFRITKLISESIISERISRVLHILIASGVHIEEAIEISIDTIDNSYARNKLKSALRSIENGNSVSKSFQVTGIFPKSFISMIKSGEESGNFDNSLKYISDYYQDELDREIEKFIKLIEPTMITVMGLVIGVTMVALIYPMTNLISTI